MLQGNAHIKELISSMITKQREPHSIIICGEHGQGRKTTAKFIAMQLMCQHYNGMPCGQCKHCKMIMHGTHPDFIQIESNENGNYTVESIRQMVSDAVVSPNEARFKVYLIADFDKSVQTSEQVQNILLKLIEEPPENVVVMLTANSKEAFLDTVISRCLTLNVHNCSYDDCLNYLDANSRKSHTMNVEAVDTMGGNIGLCLEYLAGDKLYNAVKICRELTDYIVARDEYMILKTLCDTDGKKGNVKQTLQLLSEVARDACVFALGGDDLVSCYKSGAVSLAGVMSAVRSRELYILLCEYIRRVNANCNQSLVANGLSASLFSLY